MSDPEAPGEYSPAGSGEKVIVGSGHDNLSKDNDQRGESVALKDARELSKREKTLAVATALGEIQGATKALEKQSVTLQVGYAALQSKVAQVADQNRFLVQENLDLRRDIDSLVALKSFIEQVAERSEVLVQENFDLKKEVKSLVALCKPPSLEDVDGIVDSRSLEEATLSGASGVGRAKHLVIPIHPPKIGHISNIFSRADDTAASDEVLLTFITTTPAERQLVQRYIELTHPRIPLAYDVVSAVEIAEALGLGLLASQVAKNEPSIINVKKILGLYRSLRMGAEEVICIDSDAIFLGSIDALFETAKANYENKRFYAAFSPIELTDHVIQACSNYFAENENRRLRTMVPAGLFSWFFDAPFYPREDAREFLTHICVAHGGLEQALLALTWHTFDHILFINFLLIRGDFKMVDIRGLVEEGRITDDLALSDLRAVEAKYGYRPAWAPLSALFALPRDEGGPEFTVAFHVDRVATASTEAKD